MPNRSSTKLPRAPKGAQFVAIEPDVWDLVVETLEYAQRLTVAPPLMMSDTPAGKRISIIAQAPDASGTVPVGQFTGQILTSLDNAAVWLLDVYVPALPT